MVQLVEDALAGVRNARVLSKQQDTMFHDLVKCIHTFSGRLEVDVPAFSLDRNHDVAAYLAFFDRAFCNLEEALPGLDDVVKKEFHDLLGVAIECIFANLAALEPYFNFGTVTE